MIELIIFGGTFNPVHIGHLHLADQLKIAYPRANVLFIPTNIPAHKSSDEIISNEHRLSMLRVALKGTSFELDDCELRRGGISYMFDTVQDVSKRYKLSTPPGLVIGDDLTGGYNSWYRSDELPEIVSFILARRTREQKVDFPYDHSYLENDIIQVSSTDIRQRIKQEAAFRFLLPERVHQYIVEHGLYR
jgi:nicotinate-nucleotide adenylyltransferase